MLLLKRILDENPDLRIDLVGRYLRTIYNLIIIHISRNEFRSAFKLIEELRELNKVEGYNSVDMQVRVFRATDMAELIIYDKLGEYQKALDVIDGIIDKLELYKGKLNKEYLISFYLKFAFTYFGAGDYNKALFWLNKILNDNEQTLRQDLYSYARLFNLIVHFELKNYELIDYLVKSTQRFLSKRNRDFVLEKAFISYIRKINKYSNSERLTDVFMEFRNEMEILFKEPENKIMLTYFDYLSWLDSKIDQSSFSLAVQNRNI